MVKAKEPVPVRIYPPQGFLVLPGKKVDELKPKNTYKIIAVKVLPYVFSNQTWILLGNPNSDKKLGWSYFGKDTLKSKNFALVR